MAQIKNILAIVDPTMQPSPGTRRAIELARRADAGLDLFMPVFDRHIDAALHLVEPEVVERAKQHLLEERMRWLARWDREIAEHGVRVSSEVSWERNAHEAVIARALEQNPDLVIMDLRRDAFLGRWSMVQPFDWRLARLCPVPLMLVQEDAPLLPKRVAAAVDPSHPNAQPADLDDRIVDSALTLSALLGTELELLHVFPYTGRETDMGTALNTAAQKLRRSDEEAFDAFAERYSVPEAQRVIVQGAPAKALIEHAQSTGIDLLVVGSQYRSGLDRLLLGSNAEALVAQAGCDLLLVRPQGFVEAMKKDGAYRKFVS